MRYYLAKCSNCGRWQLIRDKDIEVSYPYYYDYFKCNNCDKCKYIDGIHDITGIIRFIEKFYNFISKISL